MSHTEQECPNCGRIAYRESADVGGFVINGPWACPCGWCESEEYKNQPLGGSTRSVVTSVTGQDCPGCGLPDQPVDECERCEFHNLETSRYHYCGDPACYCRNLPGLGYMRMDVLDRFAAEHHARVADHEAGHPNGRGVCDRTHAAETVGEKTQ